jgi:hypothetical protein
MFVDVPRKREALLDAKMIWVLEGRFEAHLLCLVHEFF